MFQQIKTGEVVRSFDFDGRNDCYVEGVVLSDNHQHEGCYRYDIVCTKRVVDGKDVTEDHGSRGFHFYPPLNGTETTMGRMTRGVVRVS